MSANGDEGEEEQAVVTTLADLQERASLNSEREQEQENNEQNDNGIESDSKQEHQETERENSEGERHEGEEGEEREERENEGREESEHGDNNSNNNAKPVNDGSDDEDFAGFGEEEIKKDAAVASEDDDDDFNETETFVRKKVKRAVSSDDDDDDDNAQKKKQAVNEEQQENGNNNSNNSDIENHEKTTGSDGEEQGEEGGGDVDGGNNDNNNNRANSYQQGEEEQDEQQQQRQRQQQQQEESEDEDEDEDERRRRKRDQHEAGGEGEARQTDLETVLSAMRAEGKKRRKKNIDSDQVNEMDDIIASMVAEMKHSAADDRLANEQKMPGINKLKMMPSVFNLLAKSDFHASMIELGMLSAIAEWLAPLPDRSLVSIKIRIELIDALHDLGEINADYLKSSGIGKAVMFLYKHPKETKANKHKLERLVNSWSRPIFNLDSNMKQLTREERLERDMNHVNKAYNRENSSENGNSRAGKQSVDEMLMAAHENNKSGRRRSGKGGATEKHDGGGGGGGAGGPAPRPGEADFVPRARVPMPSQKDYLNRPKSSVELMEQQQKKVVKQESRLDKHKKRFTELSKSSKSSRAITMEINK